MVDPAAVGSAVAWDVGRSVAVGSSLVVVVVVGSELLEVGGVVVWSLREMEQPARAPLQTRALAARVAMAGRIRVVGMAPA
jgi:hypothetical protein